MPTPDELWEDPAGDLWLRYWLWRHPLTPGVHDYEPTTAAFMRGDYDLAEQLMAEAERKAMANILMKTETVRIAQSLRAPSWTLLCVHVFALLPWAEARLRPLHRVTRTS